MKLFVATAFLTVVWLTKGTESVDVPLGIRLVNGSTQFEGRLELFKDGEWGSVCYYTPFAKWINNTAAVACRMLGSSGGVALARNAYGSGTGKIWLDAVYCAGSETTIAYCNFAVWGETACQYGYLAISCAPWDINECDSSPCQNGGTCHDAVNSYTCDCQPGYMGVNCQTDIDECASRPCLNGATCNDHVNGYTCQCGALFTGVNCETDIDECASRPCMNGATCIDHVNGYTCQCGALFTGVNCETVTACLIATDEQRKSCGKFSHTEQECTDNGCCWDGSHAEKVCFKKLIKHCSIDESARTECPGVFATEGECTANGCCWDKKFKKFNLDSSRCYLPGYE